LLIGGMAFLINLALGLRELRWLGCDWLLGSVLVGVVFTLEEISQIWIPARTFDLLIWPAMTRASCSSAGSRSWWPDGAGNFELSAARTADN